MQYVITPRNLKIMKLSESIKIGVKTQYLSEQSDPKANRFVFAYSIEIHNAGDEAVELLSRYWHIKDDNEKVQEVSGEGVVGQKPLILPGQAFEYTSGAIIGTETGVMHGSYEMLAASGRKFNAPIAPFLLSMPHTIH